MSLSRWVGARWNTSGEMSLVLSCTRVLVVGVTSVARERGREGEYERGRERERERERGSGPARPLPSLCRAFVYSYARTFVPPPPPWTSPFIDIRRWPSCTMEV
jgi:hypothetical protein